MNTFRLVIIACSYAVAMAFQSVTTVPRRPGTNLWATSYRQSSDRSKRQERVGQLVRTELSRVIHRGSASRAEYLDASLRKRIAIIQADISPDLRQARVSVSISGSISREDDAMEKRRAFTWLVRNAKPLKHALAQKMSHMKSCPDLRFAQVDVGAAVDVMYLIDKISAGKDKRNDKFLNTAPSGTLGGVNFDEEYDEDEWDEEF